MPCYWIDPLRDPRWNAFVGRHPSASAFHTAGWLRALHRTYRFTPTAVTTCAPGDELTNALPFCRIDSFLTGRRLVSLPFSDHCEPLANAGELESLTAAATELLQREKLKYIELRPVEQSPLRPMGAAESFYFHVLDLRPTPEEIYKRFHGDCVRRKIRRAEKEQLDVEAGRSERLLKEFFALQEGTRRRHGLPPQPFEWFANVLEEMAGNSRIWVAQVQGRAVAALLMLRHGKTEVYKYGCSDAADHNRGGMQLLFWKAIQDAKAAGMEAMDLGRADMDHEGLAVFKERLGAERRKLTYYRYPPQKPGPAWGSRFAAKLPVPLLRLAGRVLYRHMG